ncbi:hypothetical protein ABVT39_013546 [Epinephelus coioides]
MATLGGSRGDRLGNTNQQKSSFASPEKVRELLNAGVSSADNGSNSGHGNGKVLEMEPALQRYQGNFRRSMKSFAPGLTFHVQVGASTLYCIHIITKMMYNMTIEFQLIKSQSIYTNIKVNVDVISERYWLVPACEPSALLAAFLERFQRTCLLAQQLPAMKPEQLKSMSLTEDVISVILQLIEDEQKRKGESPCSQPLAVQVAACIVSLCGWAASPALHAMNLPILTCSYCMRKVGLWNFHQMEGTSGDGDVSPNTVGPPAHTTGPASAVPHEGQVDQPASASSTPATTPCRMKLRSQDSTRSDQGEGASPVSLRARSRDSPSPSEELQSPLPRGKRPATRSKGQGDNSGVDGAASLYHPPKRLCLSSFGGPDELMHKNVFDPLAQHRDWCPWISVGKENVEPGSLSDRDSTLNQQGWKAALDLLMPMKKNSNTAGGSPGQDPRDKSKRVFAIFRQWQVSSSPSQ